ncbi:hypothetical protein B0A48_02412 [Cryoendolithus antarcticus]|uniref:Stc1 domain-containing protein n=1 Tax=Cryoendolithus antarcticus TaxID=1507870 RepID=A0A1V8TNW4_9PEZI|nr:hypothetical protein B0A48_02412 [Cryoendolithus antarcticus]
MGKKNNYSTFLQRSAVSTNIPLPDKIKCLRCDKVKPPASYATIRQNDLKTKMAQTPGFNAATTPVVPCMMCTGGQVTELECHMCRKWMALTKFAKTQRKNPNRAKCLECINEQIAMGNADDSDASGGSGGGSGGDNDSDGSGDSHAFTFDDDDANITAGAIPPHLRARMSSAVSESGESTVSDAANTTTTTTAAAPARRGLPSGFNPKAYSSPPARKAASSMAGSSVNDGRKFAKIPAAKPKKTAREIEDDFDDVCVSDDDENDEPFSG